MFPKRHLIFSTRTVIYPLLMVLLIWMVFWAEITFGFNLNSWGIRPRTLIGLRGIILAPFIHGSLAHAFSNTVPLLVLGMGLFYFYRDIAWKVLIYGTLLTGFLTWLIARGGSTHIGASGVAYLMVSFLFFKGIWSKNYRLIALALVVVFIYGSLIWGVFPGKPHISWEGHLSGFFSGIVFAAIYHAYRIQEYTDETSKPRARTKREAEFLNHFDEEGNFIPASEMRKKAALREKELRASEREQTQDCSQNIKVEYYFNSNFGDK